MIGEHYVIDWCAIRPGAPPPPRISARRIIALCAQEGGIPVSELTGAQASHHICIVRHLAVFLILRHCQRFTLEMTARRLGNRHHSTIFNAKCRVQNDINTGGAVFGGLMARVEQHIRDDEHVESRLR